jgi:hypothetical protein
MSGCGTLAAPFFALLPNSHQPLAFDILKGTVSGSLLAIFDVIWCIFLLVWFFRHCANPAKVANAKA